MSENKENQQHIIGYGTYVIIWLSLIALTSITVTVAGINLGTWTLFVALAIAAVKSSLVINVFMHIKYEDMIFKVFLLLSLSTLAIIFLLTYFDVFFRG